jgi:CHAT domain-containing protein
LFREPLAVKQLATLDLSDAYLAYLSACTTAYGGTELPDEVIHLASAFQLAGFPHVIGTLWPVSDAGALRMADLFYAHLDGGALPAEALHLSVRQIRKNYPDQPHLWASHIHLGP